MNIFNKTLLAISLAIAIPLSTQAHWLGNLAHSIYGKKRMLITGGALGFALSYAGSKLVNKLSPRMAHRPSLENMPSDMLNVEGVPEAVEVAQNGFDRLEQTKKKTHLAAQFGAFTLAVGLTYIAHRYNLFGEKA